MDRDILRGAEKDLLYIKSQWNMVKGGCWTFIFCVFTKLVGDLIFPIIKRKTHLFCHGSFILFCKGLSTTQKSKRKDGMLSEAHPNI